MPTVVLLDVSLSLLRYIPSLDISYEDLIQRGISHFLQLLQQNQPFEQTCLITFHSIAEITQPLTNDYNKLRTALFILSIFINFL